MKYIAFSAALAAPSTLGYQVVSIHLSAEIGRDGNDPANKAGILKLPDDHSASGKLPTASLGYVAWTTPVFTMDRPQHWLRRKIISAKTETPPELATKPAMLLQAHCVTP